MPFFRVTSGDLQDYLVECDNIDLAAITAIKESNPKSLGELIQVRDDGVSLDDGDNVFYSLTERILSKHSMWLDETN